MHEPEVKPELVLVAFTRQELLAVDAVLVVVPWPEHLGVHIESARRKILTAVRV